MKPVDLSRMSFAELRPQLNHLRETCQLAWLAHGPGTTRDVAAKANMDILTFRPRSTELYQLGLLELTDRTGHEGVYRARTLAEWEQYLASLKQPNPQQQLV